LIFGQLFFENPAEPDLPEGQAVAKLLFCQTNPSGNRIKVNGGGVKGEFSAVQTGQNEAKMNPSPAKSE
jgi:hypothetical protein